MVRRRPGQAQVRRDPRLVVIAERHPREETRRIVREQRRHGAGDGDGDRVAVEPVPGVEQEAAAGLQHPPRLGKGGDAVGEEHHPELADDKIEAGVGKGQALGVGHPEFDPLRADLASGHVEHRLVEIGRDDLGLGRLLEQQSGDDAGAGGGFEDAPRSERAGPPGEVPAIGLEQQRPQQPVVERRDRTGEDGVASAHAWTERRSRACAASSINWARMSVTEASSLTMPTDWPAMTEPVSTSPSITARLSAPAQ